MKSFRIEPGWGIIVGILIAPITCMLNAVLANRLAAVGHTPQSIDVMTITFMSLLLTAPMGFLTSRALEIWNDGDYGRARSLAAGCGIFSLFFWLWAWQQIRHSMHWITFSVEATLGALLLPFAWSLLFPIFAIFARPPKKAGKG